MASFYNNKISTTYVSIIKSLDNAALTASLKELSDGSGNATGLFMNTGGDFKVTNILEWGTLKDTGENISITKFVDEADGIANNDNDTSIPTTAAIVDYVAARITLEDLDFSGTTGTGSVDLDSQVFAIVGTTNEIETTAGSQQLQIGLPTNVTISGNLQVNGLLKGNNNLVVKDTSDRTMAAFYGGNKVELYFNDSKKFETTSDGVTVTGGLTATGSSVFTSATFSGTITGNVTGDLTGNVTATSVLADGVTATTQSSSDNSTKVATTAYVDAQAALSDTLSEVLAIGNTTGGTSVSVSTGDNINFSDSSMAIFGTGSDLKIYHDGSTSYIKDVGTGNLQIETNDLIIKSPSATETLASFATNGAVELYFNDNKKLETTSDGATVTGGLTATGGSVFTGATFSADVDWTDNAKARFGTGNDLEIYHDASNSYIKDNGTGNLKIQASTEINLQATSGESFIDMFENGAVNLYYDNSKKFETTAGGGLLTGSLSITSTLGVDSTSSFTGLISANGGIDLGDNDKIRLGDSQDLEIYHDASNSYIKDGGTGSLFLQGSNIFIQSSLSKTAILCNDSASVDLYYDSVKKFETTTTGVTITGYLIVDRINLGDNEKVIWGGGSDLQIYHDSSHNQILANTAAQDIVFKTTVSSSGDTTALTISSNGDLSTGRDVTIAGDLTVNGTTTTINTSTIAVEDSMIEMAKDNAANSLDIGTYGKYNDGSARYLGLFSDASDSNVFKLFKNLTVQPTSTVDTSDTSFALADFVAGKIGVGVNPSSRGIEVSGAGALGTLSVSDGTVETVLWGDASGTNIGGVGTNNNYGFNIYQNGGAAIEIDTSKNATFAGDVLINNGLISTIDSTGSLYIDVNHGNAYGGRNFRVSNNGVNYFNIDANADATFAGDVGMGKLTATKSGTAGVFNSGTTNVVASFTSTDGTGVIQLADSGGNVEIGAAGNDFVVQPAGGVAQLTVGSSSSTFAGTVLIDGVLNYTGLTVKGSTSSRPAVNFTNATQGALGSIFGTESRDVIIGTGASGVTALTLDSSQNATFAGDVIVGTATVAAANAAADNFVIKGTGAAVGLTISQDSNSGTGTIFFGDAASSSAAGFRYNHNTGDMAISAEDDINFTCDNATFAGAPTGDNTIFIAGSRGAADNLPAGNITFRNVSNGVGDVDLTKIQSLTGTGSNQTQKGQLTFSTNDGSTLTERMRLDSSGNFGLGTDSPDAKLEIEDTTSRTGTTASLIVEGRQDGAANVLTLRSKDFSAPTVGIGANHGAIMRWQGFDGTDFENMGYIFVGADGQTVANGDAPSYMSFGTSADGSSSPSERLRIDSDGQVIFKGTGNGVDLRFKDISAAISSETAGYIGMSTSGYSGNNGDLVLIPRTSSASNILLMQGNVGLGTDSPIVPVHIVGTAVNNPSNGGGGYEVMQVFDDTSANTGVGGGIGLGGVFNSSGTDTIFSEIRGIKENSIDSNYAGALTFSTRTNGANITERMRISSAGDVLLRGTYNPYTTSNRGNITMNGTASNIIAFTNGTAERVNMYADQTNFEINNVISGYIRFKTNNTERLRILSDGNVIIGGDALQAQGGLTIAPNYDNGSPRLFWNRANTSATSDAIRFQNDGSTVGFISYNNTSTTYSTSSDYRLKENIVELTGALDRVSQLKPSRFNFIADADKVVDGFLAHEVQDIVPEAITGEKDAMQDEEYEITPAKYKTVVHPAEDAVYETIEHPAIEEELDDDGNVIVEGQEAYTEEILVTEAKEEWSEEVLESDAVMGTRQIPNYQGIDQSKLVPLLVGAIQELEARIKELENK